LFSVYGIFSQFNTWDRDFDFVYFIFQTKISQGVLSLSMFGASIPLFSAFLYGADLVSLIGTCVFTASVPIDFDLTGCVSAVWVFVVCLSATFGAASSVSPLGKIFFVRAVGRLLFLGLKLYFSCSSAIISSVIP
jgi:hypothetical protein